MSFVNDGGWLKEWTYVVVLLVASRPVPSCRTVEVRRQSGRRGWSSTGSPTINGSNVMGTPSPGVCGEPAENNK